MALPDILSSVRKKAVERAATMLLPQPIRTAVNAARMVLPDRTERQIRDSVTGAVQRVTPVIQQQAPRVGQFIQREAPRAALNFGRSISPTFAALTSKPVIGPHSLNMTVLRNEAAAQQAERDRLNAQGRTVAANLVPFTRPANLALSIPRALPRAITSFGLDVAAPVTSLATKRDIAPVYTPKNRFEKTIFGEQPVYGFSQHGTRTANDLYKGNDPKLKFLAGAAGIPLAAIGSVADIVPGAAPEERAAKASVEEVGSILVRKYGDDAVRVLEALKSDTPEALNSIPQKTKSDILRQVRRAGGSIDEVLQGTKAAGEKFVGSVNRTKLAVTDAAQGRLTRMGEAFKADLEKIKGGTLTKEQVAEEAKRGQVLQKVVSVDQTKKWVASLQNVRNEFAKGLEEPGLTRDTIEMFKVLHSEAADAGRRLNAFKETALPGAAQVKNDVLEQILKVTENLDEVIKAAEGVNFDNPKEVTTLLRKFVKPTINDTLKEMQYINLLSSPKTHIVNAFSNSIQAGVLLPATRAVSAGLDFAKSAVTGSERQYFLKEIPEYYRGAVGSLSEAASDAWEVLKGTKFGSRPDVKYLPTGNIYSNTLGLIPRALTAADVFFTKVITSGEIKALTKRSEALGKALDDIGLQNIMEQAGKSADYSLFRSPLGAEQQGHLLQGIDEITAALYKARGGKRSGKVLQWFIPFITTPMNILKQGIEYSPAGFATIPGATNKTEQFAKAFIGSMVTYGSWQFMQSHDSTWSAPTDPEERDAFYASGRQPYAIKLGDKWVSYSKLGPIAYPIAIAASIKFYTEQNPDRVDEKKLKQFTQALMDVVSFFADQSYLTGIQTLTNATKTGWEGEKARGDLISAPVQQLIPLSSLVRWVNSNFLDPTYRQVKGPVDAIKSGLPHFSKQLSPYLNPDGEPSTRKNRFFNSLSPIQVTPANSKFERAILKAQGARSYWTGMKDLPNEQKNEILRDLYTNDLEFYNKVEKEIRYDQLGITSQDRDLIGTGVKDGERAHLILEQLDTLETPQEKNDYLKKLWDAKILTPEVNSQLEVLLKK